MATETGSRPEFSRRTFLATAGSVLASTATRLRLRALWPHAGPATAGSVLASTAALGLVGPADASTSWRMRGDAFEACSCNVTCPCNFASDPTQGLCEVIVAWRIQEGLYGTTRLDGLNLVLYCRMPGNLWQGNWTAGFYLDQRATQEQVQALGTILSGQAGGWFASLSGLIGHQLAPQQVPIQFETVNGEHRVTVPGLLEVGTERIPSPLPGQPPLDIKVSDIAVAGLYAGLVHVRRSSILKLTDPNLSFEYSRRSSLIGQFEYNGP
jgi:hypothetical protein